MSQHSRPSVSLRKSIGGLGGGTGGDESKLGGTAKSAPAKRGSSVFSKWGSKSKKKSVSTVATVKGPIKKPSRLARSIADDNADLEEKGGSKWKKAKGLTAMMNFFKKRQLQSAEFETIKIVKQKFKGLPVRPPWKRSERAVLKEKKAAIEKNKDAFTGDKLMRIKFPEKLYASTIGVGYPSKGLVYANMEIARGEREREVLERTDSGRPLLYQPLNTKIPGPVPPDVFHEYCNRMGIGVYEGEPSFEEPPSEGLDLTLFDLYWEDIRIERDVLLRELRFMPLKTKVELPYLAHFEKSMYHLSRSCYFSPGYTHKRCEDIIHIFLWMLNRRNLPLAFHIKVMQCLSLVVYSSQVFKLELVKCGGVNILVKIMQLGMVFCGLQASWAVYCLAMAAIGSPEVITEIKKQKDIDERVGEMTFHMFWYHWPTNFGQILQSVLYGPGGVANSLDTFEFL